jgi:hypothetical protein
MPKPNRIKEDPLHIYVSRAAVTSDIGISRALMKSASKSAASAAIFNANNSINLRPLLRWIFLGGVDPTQDEEASADYPKRLVKAKAMIAEHNLAKAKGQVLDSDQVKSGMKVGFELFRELHHQLYVVEFPQRARGRTSLEIEKIAEEFEERLFRELKERLEALTVVKDEETETEAGQT